VGEYDFPLSTVKISPQMNPTPIDEDCMVFQPLGNYQVQRYLRRILRHEEFAKKMALQRNFNGRPISVPLKGSTNNSTGEYLNNTLFLPRFSGSYHAPSSPTHLFSISP